MRLVYCLTAVALLALGAFVAPAVAQEPCPPLTQAFSALAERYGETPFGAGIDPDGRGLVILANPATGSWTITLTMPDGSTCIAAHGGGWRFQPAPPPGDPA